MACYTKINGLVKNRMRMMKKNKEEKVQKKSNWLQNTLLGLMLFVFGIMFKLFPATASAIIFITLGLFLMFVGITDAIAAFKYKDEDDDWRTPLLIGITSIIVSLIFLLFYWLRLQNANSIMIIVIAVWGILRCLLLLYGVIRGRIKRKGSIVSALITGTAGVLILLFKNQIMTATDIIGYALIGAGIIITFIGVYQRADRREKLEKDEREKKAAKKAEKEERKHPSESPSEDDTAEQIQEKEQPEESSESEITPDDTFMG